MFLNKTARDANPIRTVIRRVHMHLFGSRAGETSVVDFRQTQGSSTDFFRMNPDYVGLPYCFYYSTQWWHDGENYASMAIQKHDLCTDTKLYWKRANVFVGEPLFIPSPSGEEDDGVVVFVALDGRVGRSMLMTLDAKTMQEVDGTAVKLAGHIPFTAHGDFFPSTTRTREVSFV